jgi:hypothetical protein
LILFNDPLVAPTMLEQTITIKPCPPLMHHHVDRAEGMLEDEHLIQIDRGGHTLHAGIVALMSTSSSNVHILIGQLNKPQTALLAEDQPMQLQK